MEKERFLRAGDRLVKRGGEGSSRRGRAVGNDRDFFGPDGAERWKVTGAGELFSGQFLPVFGERVLKVSDRGAGQAVGGVAPIVLPRPGDASSTREGGFPVDDEDFAVGAVVGAPGAEDGEGMVDAEIDPGASQRFPVAFF